MADDLFGWADGEEGKSRRDEGMELVLDSLPDWWKDEFYDWVRARPVGWRGIGESYRAEFLLDTGFSQPKPQAWGALINTCIRRGWLLRSTEEQQMRSPSSHARTSHILVRTDMA